MPSSFRDFLVELEKRGLLRRVSVEVDTELEVSEIVLRVAEKGGPALLFEKPKGTKIPLSTNLFGTEERFLIGLESESFEELQERVQWIFRLTKPSSIVEKVKDLARLKDLAPKERKRPPFYEVTVKGDAVDLSAFPILKCWPGDAGRFVTMPVVVSKDPKTGTHNLGMYRMQVLDRNKTAMHWQVHKDGRRIAERWGKKVPVAVAVGCHPVFIYLATAPVPQGLGDYLFGSMLLGRSLELSRTKLYGLMVPYDAEVVFEGFVDTEELVEEGPFGDHTGHYTPKDLYPVFHVEAVYMRRDPIFVETVVGRPFLEDGVLGYATERIFLPIVKKLFPEVVDWHIPREGAFHNFLFVSINKSYPGHAFKVINGLWGLSGLSTMKHIVVFDDDVDVHNLKEVLWAWGNNTDPSRDVVISKGPLDALDHACGGKALGGRMGIDATRKLKEEGVAEWPEKTEMTQEVKRLVERRWKEYGL